MISQLTTHLTWVGTALILGSTSIARALEINVAPTAPQLGDTISIFLKPENPETTPTVTVEEQEYPVFPIDNGYRALIPTSPLDEPGKVTVKIEGDGETRNIGVWVKNRTFPTQRIRLTGKANSSATQTEIDKVAAFRQLVTPEKLWEGEFVRPNQARVSTEFGVRRYYNDVFAENYYHRGVDYAGAEGSVVVAPAAGRVKLVGKEAEGFKVHGNTIGIDHGQGVLSLFLHLKDINVQEGDMVKAGQPIGTVGATGASTGPHLHWGLYVHGVAVSPVPWRFSIID
ncbi:MAG: peptidoglycan DD-metalloendopeptidase family protein [Xenococcaceae cyanobacterium]